MLIHILTIGPLKKSHPFRETIDWYQSRIQTNIQIVEIASEAPTCLTKHTNLWKKHTAGSPVWALDLHGENWSDVQWAHNLQGQRVTGTKRLCLAVGGTYGLPASVTEAANKTVSLSQFTWNHLLMRILLLEVVYRCEKIWENHPYAHT